MLDSKFQTLQKDIQIS